MGVGLKFCHDLVFGQRCNLPLLLENLVHHFFFFPSGFALLDVCASVSRAWGRNIRVEANCCVQYAGDPAPFIPLLLSILYVTAT